jgi:hypothetical protein
LANVAALAVEIEGRRRAEFEGNHWDNMARPETRLDGLDRAVRFD